MRPVTLLSFASLSSAIFAQPASPESAEEPIMVAILWHQHQPHYLQDVETGESAQPWVRLHAVKDYYDMVSILEDHPDIRFTVNLTPVLINQMQDLLSAWASGEPTDIYVRHTLADADQLTDPEKAFILRNFFSLNWDRMLTRHPRYVELRDAREASGEWTAQDFRDLQMLFNLAWMDPDFFEGVTLPDGTEINVGHWVEQGRDFTEEDKRALLEMHFQIMAQVIPIHAQHQEAGQIEVSTTPYYHPILPLIIDTSAAQEAVPDITLPQTRFQFPDDAGEHVERAVAQYQELFGREPRGMWPGEGSVSQAILPLLSEAGFEWFATDVQILTRSIGGGDPPARQRFTMWSCAATPERVAGIFRDTGLSDLIGFTYSGQDGEQAARDFVGILTDIRNTVAQEAERPLGQHVIPIILDGENCWEAYENDGKEFLHTLYTLLAETPGLDTVTISECLERSGDLPQIERLAAGSWINANFETWIGEPEENRAWELLAAARQALENTDFETPEDRERVLRLLLIAEGSDWFWWYGGDQTVDNEQAFDEQFRGTLRQVYQALGRTPPPELDQPLMAPATGAATSGGVMAPGQ